MTTIIVRDKDGHTEEIPVEKLVIRPSVYVVVLHNDSVLLSRQWDGWDFPGGGVHVGERLYDALVREVREETGITVTPGKLLHVADDFFKGTRDRYFHSILLYYLCTNPDGEISTAGFDEYEKEYAQAAQWLPLSEAMAVKFFNPVDSPTLIRMANTEIKV